MNLNIKQKVVDTINEARAKGITFSQMSIATGSNDRTLMTIKKMGCAYPMRESYGKRLIEEISKLKSLKAEKNKIKQEIIDFIKKWRVKGKTIVELSGLTGVSKELISSIYNIGLDYKLSFKNGKDILQKFNDLKQ